VFRFTADSFAGYGNEIFLMIILMIIPAAAGIVPVCGWK
jgi:hypothetical protein